MGISFFVYPPQLCFIFIGIYKISLHMVSIYLILKLHISCRNNHSCFRRHLLLIFPWKSRSCRTEVLRLYSGKSEVETIVVMSLSSRVRQEFKFRPWKLQAISLSITSSSDGLHHWQHLSWLFEVGCVRLVRGTGPCNKGVAVTVLVAVPRSQVSRHTVSSRAVFSGGLDGSKSLPRVITKKGENSSWRFTVTRVPRTRNCASIC